MENFKLDLSKLTPIPEEYRVKGNWYVVADDIDSNELFMARWNIGSHILTKSGLLREIWPLWFAIPPNLPGFPSATTPDIITLPLSEWAYSYNNDVIVLHRKKYVPTLVIPAGTVEERKKRLQEELDKLG